MSISPEKLIAYVDGELGDAEHAEVEVALAADKTLLARVEQARAMRRRLSAAFDPTLTEIVPANLIAAAHATPRDNVVTPPRSTWGYREWGAMAASLAGGLVLGLGAMNTQAPTLAGSANGLIARGALAKALETQTASNTDNAVRIGISFQARDGAYCRTFGVARDHVAGLACKQDEEWRVPMTAQLSAPAGEIRTAGSDTPAPILRAVDQMIAGDPLDAHDELAARDKHWRAGE